MAHSNNDDSRMIFKRLNKMYHMSIIHLYHELDKTTSYEPSRSSICIRKVSTYHNKKSVNCSLSSIYNKELAK